MNSLETLARIEVDAVDAKFELDKQLLSKELENAKAKLDNELLLQFSDEDMLLYRAIKGVSTCLTGRCYDTNSVKQ